MQISLIGMSNVGKTFSSRRLAATKAFNHIDCDALIEKKLGPELTQLGLKGIQGLASWMGFPDTPSYAPNSKRYLDFERHVMLEALGALPPDANDNGVLDTTGSVIYTGDDVLEKLRTKTRVIYFEASDAHIDALFKSYMSFPKPVIWGDMYAPKGNETPHETLERCYPLLLRDRARRYKKIAHVTISYDDIKTHVNDIEALVLKAAQSS